MEEGERVRPTTSTDGTCWWKITGVSIVCRSILDELSGVTVGVGRTRYVVYYEESVLHWKTLSTDERNLGG